MGLSTSTSGVHHRNSGTLSAPVPWRWREGRRNGIESEYTLCHICLVSPGTNRIVSPDEFVPGSTASQSNHNHTVTSLPPRDDFEFLISILHSPTLASSESLSNGGSHAHSESDIRRIFREEFARLRLRAQSMTSTDMGEAPPLYQER
jgi:hypothetical protein